VEPPVTERRRREDHDPRDIVQAQT
jgi:hypothetical protein